MTLEVTFIDGYREPKCKPNAEFPNGMDVDFCNGASKSCFAEIPYPAPRCGVMRVYCSQCGISLGLTVAGRIDDPRSIKIPCYTIPTSFDRIPRDDEK